MVEHQELTVTRGYEIQWRRQDIDLTELAKRRWIEKWSIEKLAEHFKCGPTFVKKSLRKIKANPDLAKAKMGYRRKRPWSLAKRPFRGIK